MQNKQDYKDEIQEIIQKIRSAKKLSEVLTPKNFAPVGGWADKITQQIKKQAGKYDQKTRKKFPPLKTSQLRKIFSEVKEICQKKNEVELYLLYPKLAYAEGRDLMPSNFYELLITCLDKLKENADKEDFKSFEQFMTAIVAYNKKYD
ncbi:MAG: type III-A CRISPR-associated protein Csm2 [Hydrogenothermus sp.]|nr:MAG: type III-A CRISPR-associated protein Csm2 [Hydrogenothermus sp.]